ncbi:DEAD/DEAH box helicase [Clostridium perfringens]|uniref:DEAD/DEAH box helicase n=1 Tax=Clostridium perfringens TaxID=1502 RepID=UPI00016BD978|nr:SNF2-related protein [Clostridium perfringens]EDT79135.1 putative helicase [Clostridium perfringens NCTC 8239]EHK2426108.1 SNF2 helicase associated domain-containing protein [Clostridium perfringens]ELC8384020.1 SNF2 helicase associated domain-containing protein [Clostridium perfringens]MDT7912387.1 SNF2-related protein [Clostridium perfringens]MDT7925446.1 SNF2-related protein [Clostridium perfringens]
MNLDIFMKNLVRRTSSFTREQGKKLIKEAYVKDVKGKCIDGIYHIYGSVLNDDKNWDYNTHIKINMQNSDIIGTNCSCETFKENSKHIKNYVCKHISATNDVFYSLAKKKMQKNKLKSNNKPKLVKEKNEEHKGKEKRFLSLDINIKHMVKEGITLFNCEFRIGTGNLILDLKDFLYKNSLKKPLKFNDGFTYNPLKDEFLDEDKRVLQFVASHKDMVSGRYLRLKQNNLKDFLKLVDEKKKINFNFNSINYEVKVKKENVPVALTLKEGKEGFVLSHHKKFPVILNNSGDVMFFDRNLYLPRKRQLEYYIPIHKLFLKNNTITYKKSLENLRSLLEELKNISKNIVLDENIRVFKEKLMKTTFNLYKTKGRIYCNVKIDYCGYIIDLIRDEKDNSFLRDLKSEKYIEFQLERFKFIKREEDFCFIGSEEEMYELFSKGIKRLRELGEVLLLEELKGFKVLDSSLISSELKELSNFYKLKFDFGDFELRELRESIDAMKRGDRFYRTKKVYLDLEDPGIVNFLNLLEDLGLENINDNEVYIDKSKVLYIQEKLKDRNLSFIKGGNVLQEIVGKLLNKEFKRKLVPKALNAELRPYQKEGFKWINEITDLGFGGVLADDMGLGKTLQIIAFLLSQKKSKSIVVVPTSVIYNWMDEFEKFAPSIRIGLVHGSKSKRDKVLREFKRGLGIKIEEDNLKEKSYEKYDVLLTTYGTLKNDEKAYENLSFDYCIIDEAQNIKNPAAQATLSVKNIKSRCNIALTGTPIENNLMELWSIFDFVMPGYLFTKERFRERFILDESNLSELKYLITPFILRRLKEDVLSELPEKLEKKYLVEMKGKQKQLYSFYVKAIKNQLNENKSSEKSGRDKINLFSYLTKLREICLDPSLVVPDYTGGSSKLTVVKEIVKDASESGKKILLFSQFTSVLQKIEEDFKKEDISYLYLDGGTSAKDRVERVKKFNEDSNIKVFLISLKAGGVGLNLTSASVVIHFDPWWNPAVEDQATDRAHRFGQENKVEVIKLVAKDTIEEKIVLMQEDKRELIQSLMDGKTMDGKGLKRLTEEEISKLFE